LRDKPGTVTDLFCIDIDIVNVLFPKLGTGVFKELGALEEIVK
jgi:hypothetical protein